MLAAGVTTTPLSIERPMTMSNTTTLADLAISDNGFVFDPFAGATFSVNPTGLCVLQALKEGLDPDAIAQRLADRFDRAPQDPLRDVDEFLRLLRQHSLIPAGPSSDLKTPRPARRSEVAERGEAGEGQPGSRPRDSGLRSGCGAER
jgi:hypothetical protein